MNMTEAIAAVVGITKRPDKNVEIISSLNKAIAFFTLKANFSKDLVELSLPISSTLLGQTLDLSDIALGFTRFRKMSYLRPRGQRYFLKDIEPSQILTPKGNVQPNRYYIAGNNLTFTLSTYDSFLECGYFQYAPLLTTVTGNNTHWMLDLMPWAITERAASQILKSIGDDLSARFYENSSMEFFLAARRDFEIQIAASAS